MPALARQWSLITKCAPPALPGVAKRITAVHFWTTFLTGFGGGTLTAFMMMVSCMVMCFREDNDAACWRRLWREGFVCYAKCGSARMRAGKSGIAA